jgi:hypothetical protein
MDWRSQCALHRLVQHNNSNEPDYSHNIGWAMSVLGHQRRFGDVRYESAFPQISDMTVHATNGRNGPGTDIPSARQRTEKLVIGNEN